MLLLLPLLLRLLPSYAAFTAINRMYFKAESVRGSHSTTDARLQDIPLKGTKKISRRAWREKNLRLSMFMDGLPCPALPCALTSSASPYTLRQR
jgi:hypothetical protein